ncbi:hypothetical protein [Reichenbachiella agariperforans]|uniref:hypothetical protein n=1 Tax=Reichenbachiella agariperforans TaxID=156994 RepID=UPI001C0A2B3F|nr:hypothetical protein [Reichenbachiella agariperforans]MBU2914259.1 hypothetical protein [Reichenbachiella agariperforans]
MYVKEETRFPVFQKLGLVQEWRKLKVTWWPTEDESDLEPKYMQEEYKNIFVENLRIIFAESIGYIDDRTFAFKLKTSNDIFIRSTTISGTNTQFPHKFSIIR